MNPFNKFLTTETRANISSILPLVGGSDFYHRQVDLLTTPVWLDHLGWELHSNQAFGQLVGLYFITTTYVCSFMTKFRKC